MVERYLDHYKTLQSGQNYDEIGNFRFDNLIKVMLTTLPATDWLPPLMRYYDKFRDHQLHEFLTKLDNKFSADWISQLSPTDRIEAMNLIIRMIDEAESPSRCYSHNSLLFQHICF